MLILAYDDVVHHRSYHETEYIDDNSLVRCQIIDHNDIDHDNYGYLSVVADSDDSVDVVVAVVVHIVVVTLLWTD